MATLVALLGAMFVAMGSGSAQTTPDPVGSVDANKGYCIVATGLTVGEDSNQTRAFLAKAPVETPNQAAYDARIQVVTDGDGNKGDFPTPGCSLDVDTDLEADANSDGNLTNDYNTSSNLNRPFSITPNGTNKPLVVRLTPTATISFTDSDDIVGDGTDVMATVTFSNLEGYGDESATGHNATQDEIVITRAQVSGELDNPVIDTDPDTNGVQSDPISYTAGESASLTFTIENPKGTTAGTYTFSVTAHFLIPDGDDDDADPDQHRLTPSKTFRVGDPGTNADSVSISLGNRVNANSLSGASAIPETGSVVVGGSILLRVDATNSLGNPSNDGGLTGLTVLGVGSHITLVNNDRGVPGDAFGGEATSDTSASISGSDVGPLTFVRVKKAGGASATPGSVDLWAQLVGKDGAARTETITVSFTGPAKSLVLGTAPAVSRGEMKEFTIDAEDAGGSDASVDSTKLTFSVEGPDGKAKGTSVLKVEPGRLGEFDDVADDPATKLNNDANQVTGVVTAGAKAPPGEYTVTVSLVGVTDSESTTVVTISGDAANVDLDVDNLEPAVTDGFVTATATITDAGGNPVADGTPVTFNASGADRVLDEIEPTDGHKTMDGMSKARFVVIGAGTSKISVVAGDGLAVATVVVGGGSEAMPEEEASVSCLSELSGFATWSCGVSADASEIFGMVSARGVSAIHLWNGSTWVRYSVVDDAMVPGSSDFMVTENDILYISN